MGTLTMVLMAVNIAFFKVKLTLPTTIKICMTFDPGISLEILLQGVCPTEILAYLQTKRYVQGCSLKCSLLAKNWGRTLN